MLFSKMLILYILGILYLYLYLTNFKGCMCMVFLEVLIFCKRCKDVKDIWSESMAGPSEHSTSVQYVASLVDS